MTDCLRVSCYFGERQRHEGRLLSDTLLDTFEEHDLTASILLRATAGFGLRHHLRSDQTLTMSEDPTVLALATDRAEKVRPVLPRLRELQQRGLLTVERARMLRGDELSARWPGELEEAARLTIQVGRHEQVSGVPAYVAVCELLHRRGVAGATVLVGVDGTRHGVRERARFWDRNLDVPSLVWAVGDGDCIRQVLPEVTALLRRPLSVVERVQVCKRDGVLLARPRALPAEDAPGRDAWQKLTVYSSEEHLHHGEPVHRGIVRRLRAGGARGATALRGVWGYHGDRAPHGDRLLQLGRRVPVVTVVVDTPDRIARAFDVVDELTTGHGLVTSEPVPAVSFLDGDSCRVSPDAV